ncbi:MAG: aminomethyl-transferring glycine dehydrogenase subunit GcvPA [Lachnospiraceae bacterium]|nr:aminomethyl-transferring glycine dehydrogenase subunit GcvPA [Lachnospiraceae bacterium]
MGSYVPSTADERKEMLNAIGLASMEDLFSDVPSNVKLEDLDLPSGKSELTVASEMEELADKNVVFKSIFRGAGAYNHYIPAIVKSVTSKEEFVTAYTPYQAEVSQGILQSIFEYQTMICELTGMDVSNASVYDGASAAAEAVAMCRDRKRTKAVISATTHPQVIETVKTYCMGAGTECIIVPAKDGKTDMDALGTLLEDKSVACFYVQQPNFYGQMEECEELGQLVHDNGAKFIMGCNPIALAVMKTPKECGADIAVGEGQPLGMPMAFGGPYLGYMAASKALMRKLPGRIVGQTEDVHGQRAFVLTLQAREQHIRREKASSNICSNQALCALTASAYMTAMGKTGMEDAATQCHSKACYLAGELTKIEGIDLVYTGEYFHEFVTTCPGNPDQLLKALEKEGILGGYPIEQGILWCTTEKNTKAQIDALVEAVRRAVACN